MKRRRWAILGIAAVGGLAACGREETISGAGAGARVETTAVDEVVATPRIASTDEWRNEGERILADKADARESGPYETFGNSGAFAFLTEPVDVTGPGEYRLTVGNLPADFDYPRSPSGLSYNTPADTSFDMTISSIEVEGEGDARSLVLRAAIPAESFKSAYPAFSVWIY